MDIDLRHPIGPADPEAAAVLLARRPARWLRPFLVLATGPACASRSPWFRLGPFADDRAELVWRPRCPEAAFERFVGHLDLERPAGPGDPTPELAVRGTTEGDEHQVGVIVVERLLAMLAPALASATTRGGRARGQESG